MGLQIVLPNTNFSKYIDIVNYPLLDSATSLFFLGGGSVPSTQNGAPNGLDATVVGTVNYSDYYGIFVGGPTANYIQTEELDATANLTYVSVVRRPTVDAATGGGRSIFGGFNDVMAGASFLSTGLFISDGTTYKQASHGQTLPEADFHFRAGTISGSTVKSYAVNGSGGVAVAYTVTNPRGLNTVRKLRIGGHYTTPTNLDDEAHIAMVAKHNVALDIPQLQLVYNFLKSYYAKRGMSVL